MTEPVSEQPSASKDISTTKEEIVSKLTPLLKPEKQEEGMRLVNMVMQKTHRGPLPPPEDLAHYDHILPGAADRILTMAESNMAHRHSMEKDNLKKDYGLKSRGQFFALMALVLMLGLVAFSIHSGHPIAGTTLGGFTIASIIAMFLGRDKPPQEVQSPTSPPSKNKNLPASKQKQQKRR